MKRIAVFVTFVFFAILAGTGQAPVTGQIPGVEQAIGTGQIPSNDQVLGAQKGPIGSIPPVESNVPIQSPSPVELIAPAGGIVASRPNLPQMASAGEMIGFSHVDGSGNLTITLVHTGKSWMSVYHVDSKGTIRLASSRPIDADFTLQLNATDPLPEDIRQMADRVSSGR